MPAFVAVGSPPASASATSLSVPIPSLSGNPRGVFLAVVCSANNAEHTTATPGWTRVGAQVNSGTGFTASLWIAPDTASSPTFTWSGAAACSAQAYHYASLLGPVDTAVGGLSSNSGSTNPHTTAGFTATRSGSLAVYVDASSANTALSTPAGWTEREDRSLTPSADRLVVGDKPLTNAGDASGAISVTGAAAPWVQWQVELMLAPASPDLSVSKMETGGIIDPGAGLNFSKMEIGSILENPSELSVSYMETGTIFELMLASRRRQVLLGSF